VLKNKVCFEGILWSLCAAAGLMVMILWGALGAVASDDQDHSQSVVTSEKTSLAKRLAEIRSKVVRLTALEQNHKGRRVSKDVRYQMHAGCGNSATLQWETSK
jgi:hypothetical protein